MIKAFAKYPELRLHKGQVLIASSTDLAGVYYLQSGIVRQTVTSESGHELVIHLFRPESFFPLTWAIADIPNTSDYLAETDIMVRQVPKEVVCTFLKTHPDVLYDSCKRLLTAIAGLTTRIQVTSLESAETRLASMRAYLDKAFPGKKFTHQQLADLTGLARETVTKKV